MTLQSNRLQHVTSRRNLCQFDGTKQDTIPCNMLHRIISKLQRGGEVGEQHNILH